MNKKKIQSLIAVLFCLFLMACASQSTPTDRRPAEGGSSNNTADHTGDTANTNQNRRPAARNCQAEVGDEALINLVVIVGNRANTYEIPVGSAVDDALCNVIGRTFEISGLEAEGNIAFVVSDGAPWRAEVLAQNGRLADLRVSANNDYVLNNRIKNTISNVIIPFMNSEHLIAQNEEADLLEALHVANRILRDMDSDRENHILIIDSGITTTGHIDMRAFNILDNGVPTEVVNRLETANLLPDLTGVYVSFFNIGNGAAPQQVPSGPVEDALITFWYEVIGATGAQILHIQGRGEGGNPRTTQNGHPFVSTVEFDAPQVDLSDLRSEIFSAESLGFIADESDFVDEQQARNLLAAIAEKFGHFLQQNPTHRVYIIGSQAMGPGGNTNEYALSLERAKRVKDFLVSEFNLSASQVSAIGAGTTPLSWRNTDEFEAGVWRDELAQENRVVAVVPSTASEMVELRGHGLVD